MPRHNERGAEVHPFCPPDVLDWLDAVAKRNGVTRTRAAELMLHFVKDEYQPEQVRIARDKPEEAQA